MDDRAYQKQMMMLAIRRQWEDMTRKMQSAATPEAKAAIQQAMLVLRQKYEAVARS